MDIRIILVTLTFRGKELHLVLPRSGKQLPSSSLQGSEPDEGAKEIAKQTFGSVENIERHDFRSPEETGLEGLTLLYRQLIPEDVLSGSIEYDNELVPLSSVNEKLSPPEAALVSQLVEELQSDLNQVMQSRLHKRGLVHLLNVLPDIFDHKELAAAYQAFSGEKPTSPLMLARMMLDRYVIGSGEKQREVRGRDLIREYETDKPELLDEKWNKNKELYRTGGPKAKRLYKKSKAS